MSQNKYYFTAERKAQHEEDVGLKWHSERNKALRKEQLKAHFDSGGTQCSKCGELFVPDENEKYVNQLQSRIAELELFKKEALEMAEFYGGEGNWHTLNQNRSNNIVITNDDIEDLGGVLRWVRNFGGKRARQFLAKWR